MYFYQIYSYDVWFDDGSLDSSNEFAGRPVIKEFRSGDKSHIYPPSHYSTRAQETLPELDSRPRYELDSRPVFELDNGNSPYELWDRSSPLNYTQPHTYQAYHPGLIQTSQGFRSELHGDSNVTTNH